MLARTIVVSNLVLGVVCSAALIGQQKPEAAIPPATEFPVTLQQSVVAGKTPVGTRIQAKLAVATLVEGVVVPRNAMFSGEVTQSVAKTKTDPSRLALRIDSVLWKSQSAPITLYLTAWFYPGRDVAGQDLQYGPQQPANRTWNGQGQYPDPNSKVYQPFPSEPEKGSSVPDTPTSVTSDHRVLMKGIESTSHNNGIELVCKRSNIKLDKLTTYVLAPQDLVPSK